ncbi:MAG: hypothetical protein M0D57_22250 [Sphingobacteriales bacterium JAD_PAG50586_3]|nr:MAG: hypothetical protein M0D57_22250 [Sphingobacteriales bacterium JAD_PAG50586_3]
MNQHFTIAILSAGILLIGCFTNLPTQPIKSQLEARRDMLLNTRLDTAIVDSNFIYGVITDFYDYKDFYSHACFIDNNVIVLQSRNGGYANFLNFPVNDEDNLYVTAAAKTLINNSKELLSSAELKPNLPLPDSNYVRFNFLTLKGIYVIEDTKDAIENGNSKLKSLYTDLQVLHTECAAAYKP